MEKVTVCTAWKKAAWKNTVFENQFYSVVKLIKFATYLINCWKKEKMAKQLILEVSGFCSDLGYDLYAGGLQLLEFSGKITFEIISKSVPSSLQCPLYIIA